VPVASQQIAAKRAQTQQAKLPLLATFRSQCAVGGTKAYAARHRETAEQLLPAFGVFTQGTALRTPDGSVAIEDTVLGDTILDHLGREVAITWIGEVTLTAGLCDTPYLRRVQAERFGMARPFGDVMLGAGAQVLTDPYGQQTRALEDLTDGEMILPIRPQSSIRLFHIATDGPQPAFVGAEGIAIRTLDAADFMTGQDPLFARSFSKLLPGGDLPQEADRFVTDSPFRRARLG